MPMNDPDHDALLRLDGDVRVLAEKIDSLTEVVRAEFDARDKALLGVAEETERVRQQQNEWRGTVTDLASNKVDITRYEERSAIIDSALNQIRDELAKSRGRDQGVSAVWGLIVAGAIVITGIIGAVVALLH